MFQKSLKKGVAWPVLLKCILENRECVVGKGVTKNGKNEI